MTNSLGQILTAKLQLKGISSDDYNTIADAVYDSLHELSEDMSIGNTLEFPNGSTLKLVFKARI